MQEGKTVSDTFEQNNCASVSPATEAQQAQDIHVRWAWAEASVWSKRMLMTLEKGMEGGKWFRLIDKVWQPSNLQRAWEKVRRNGGSPGVDGISIERFDKDRQNRLLAVNEQLKNQRYEPKPVKRVWIQKPGSRDKRPLGVPCVTDRVVQGALRQVIEPIFERDFAEHSYGFRPQRGCKDALRRVDQMLKSGKSWVVDADLKSYFDTIPHERLMEQVARKVADGRVLALIRSYLKTGVMDGLKHDEAGEEGTPQGAVISPLLANIYLDPLDHLMAREGYEMVRYADDFVVLCDTQEEAQAALANIQQWVEAAGLKLHPEKTRIVNVKGIGGFDFLGYTFCKASKWPRKKSLQKFKDNIRAGTRRNDGRSMKDILASLKRQQQGWFNYFKHCPQHVFRPLDEWTRRRLRSILRRRLGKDNRSRGIINHECWPNDYFRQLGFYSLVAARAQAMSLR
jgi:RNA-directed DNA polymerase